MKIGVVSDSHGEIENLIKIGKWLVDKQNVEVIVHLGDDYDDALVLENLGVRILKVPGVFSKYYQDEEISNRIVETFNGRKVLITHTECSHEKDLSKDIKPEILVSKKAVDIVLYGHTHIPRIEQRRGILFVNPGHLKTQDKKGYPPTSAVIDFNNQISVNIFDLMGGLLQHEIF